MGTMPGTSTRSKIVAVRFPLDLLARVEAEARRREALAGVPVSLGAALVALVRAGLDGVTPVQVPAPAAPHEPPGGPVPAPLPAPPAPPPADPALPPVNPHEPRAADPLRARALRARAQGHPLRALARACETHPGTFGHWLEGKRPLGLDARDLLARWLDGQGL
jgi:hypothetical protein